MTMKNTLYGLKAAWRAELLKIKGSRIILMTCILGLFLPLLYNFISVMVKYYSDINLVREKIPYNVVIENITIPLMVYGSFFFPLTLILVTSRLATLEHKSDTWKLVETQPVSRFSFWIVKWGMAALMSMFAILVFLMCSIISTYFLFYFKLYDKYAFVKIPLPYLLAASTRIWLSSLGIITFQLTISMLIRSTIWPIVIGVIMLLLTNISLAMQSSLATIWPYALPLSTASFPEGSEIGNWLLPSEKQGILWLLIIPLAFLLYRYRISFRQSFSNKFIWLLSLACLGVLGLGTWWLQQPKSIALIAGKTIIAGVIKADHLPDSIEIFKVPIGTERAVVNKDGTFRFDLTLFSDVEKLELSINKSIPSKEIYAGNGDSIFVDWSQGKSPDVQKIKLSGTAIATNNYFSSLGRPQKKIEYYIESTDYSSDETRFYAILIKEWQNDMEEINKFKTTDGLGLSAAVKELQEKLITADYLSIALYKFPEKQNIDLNSTEFNEVRKNLEPLQKKLQPFEQKLVGWTAYNDYLYLQITRSLPSGINQDSAYYATIMKKPAGPMRNSILYNFAVKKLQASRDSITRANILKDMAVIDNKDMQLQLKEQTELLNRIRKGQPAPIISLHNEKNEQVNLAMLKGKYVVIDVWATWCAPCREEAPVFQTISEKYKTAPITFLSISIDDDLSAWQQDIKRKKSRIIQWRTYQKVPFSELYGFKTIPHFIVLDPEGNFFNASFPPPSDPNFEILLRQMLNLKAEEG